MWCNIENNERQQKGGTKVKKLLMNLVLTVAVVAFTSNVWAQPFTPTMAGDTYDSSPDVVATPEDTAVDQNIHDAVNLLLGTGHTANEQIDGLRWGADEEWVDLSTDANDGTFIFISITAANSNTLGVYEVGGGPDIPVLGPNTGFLFSGDGSNGNPFDAALSPLAPGANFGWFLNTTDAESNTIRWDSDPTQNVFGNDQIGLDHMLTYHLDGLSGQTVWIQIGANPPVQYTFDDPYLLAWEDLDLNGSGLLGDEDFNDTIFLVDRVKPVPEPMSMMLFGSGLLGLVGSRLRKRNV